MGDATDGTYTCAHGVTRKEPRQSVVITALGITQIFAWGCSYYLLAVLATPITSATGWSLQWVVGGLSLGLLVAGLVSPVVGRAIQDYGGRPVLAISSILLAAGLIALGLSQNIAMYLAGWIVIGFGMGAGLYDAAFATLGRIYRERARGAITMLTLFGGFSSAICWPLSWLLVQSTGWRTACLIYAGLQLVVSLPIYLLLLPQSTGYVPQPKSSAGEPTAPATDVPSRKNRFVLFALVGAAITLSAVIQSTMSVHLLTILQKRGVGQTTAVAFGTVVGPSQVLARVFEMIIGRHFHPIWTMLTSTTLIAGGLLLLWLHLPIIALGVIFHGAGMGIMSIARGTVPLALFGASNYAVLMGRLALPSLLAQAISPLLGAEILESAGAGEILFVLFGRPGKTGGREGGEADHGLLCSPETLSRWHPSMDTEAEAIQSSPRFFLVPCFGRLWYPSARGVKNMNSWHVTYLGLKRLPRDLTAFEVEAFFTFSVAERRVIEARRGPELKLGLALQIGFLRMSGRLLDALRIVPARCLAAPR